jgi:hypothetical protein
MQDLRIWNGTTWTEIADLNTARDGSLAAGYTAALVFAGKTTAHVLTEA